MDTLKIGVIGCGKISTTHFKGYTESSDAEIAACADVAGKLAEAKAKEFGGTAYDDYKKLLDNEKLDAVSICTPPAFHKEIALAALSRGIHVLCEKPLAVTAADCREIIEAAKNKSLMLQTAYKRRLWAPFMSMRDMVADGSIGKLVYFRNMFAGWLDFRDKWFSDPKISGGGSLMDIGCHAVDLVRFIAGEPVAVAAVTANRGFELAVEDTFAVKFKLASGAIAQIDGAWSVLQPLAPYAEVYGTKGSAITGDLQSGSMLEGDSALKPFPARDDVPAGAQMEHFCTCIKTGTPSEIFPIEDGMRVQEIIEAAYKATNERCWVDL